MLVCVRWHTSIWGAVFRRSMKISKDKHLMIHLELNISEYIKIYTHMLKGVNLELYQLTNEEITEQVIEMVNKMKNFKIIE